MNGMPAFVNAFASAAVGSLFASVWQGTVLVLAVALALRLSPGLPPSVRSSIWSAVLLLVAGLPLIFWFWPNTYAHPAQAHAAIQLNATLAVALAGLWLALSVFRLAQLAISAIHLHSLLQRAVPFAASAEVSRLLGHGKRQVKLCTSHEVDLPGVAGFRRPRILLPARSLWEADSRDLEQVVLHEMGHLRRRDGWINLLQKLALAMSPLHPVLAWLDRRVSFERELACDDDVLKGTRAPKAYAECLTRLAESRMVQRGFSLVLGALGPLGRQHKLARRVQRILSAQPVRMGRRRSAGLTASLFVGILTGAALLARSPRLISFEEAASQPEVLRAGTQVSPQGNGGAARALLVNARASYAATPPGALRPAVFHLDPGTAHELNVRRNPTQRFSRFPVRRSRYRDLTGRSTLAMIPIDPPPTYAFVAMRDGWLLI